MKQTILNKIYEIFADWAKLGKFSCSAGCATCCTRNVTLTNQEAKRILNYFSTSERANSLLEILTALELSSPPGQTTNEYILSCIEGREKQEKTANTGGCPFLADNLCTIYPVRPFSCRCFASTTICTTQSTAAVPDHYLYGSMAVMQLIEHLDQFNSWGIMTDMLLVLSQTKQYREKYKNPMIAEKAAAARNSLRSARPLPGFIIPETYIGRTEPLIQSILQAQIDHRTIEQIFNGQR